MLSASEVAACWVRSVGSVSSIVDWNVLIPCQIQNPIQTMKTTSAAICRVLRCWWSAYIFMDVSDHMGAGTQATRVAGRVRRPVALGRVVVMSNELPSKSTNAFFLQAGISFGIALITMILRSATCRSIPGSGPSWRSAPCS